MASETSIESHQTSIVDEQIEQKVKEDKEKTTIQESLSFLLSKKIGEEGNKQEDLPSITTSLKTKIVDDKKIEPHVVEVLKAIDTLELDVQKEPYDSSLSKEREETFSYQTQPFSKFECQQNNKLIQTPPFEVDKVIDAPKSIVLMEKENATSEEEKLKIENITSLVESCPEFKGSEAKLVESLIESETLIAPKMVVEIVESQRKNLVISESKENREPKKEIEEKGQDEKPTMVDSLKPSIQAIKKPIEKLDVTTTQESEETILKENVDSKPRGQEKEETLRKTLEHEEVVLKGEVSLTDKVEHHTEISSLPIVMEKLASEEEKKEANEIILTTKAAKTKILDIVETFVTKNVDDDEDEKSNANKERIDKSVSRNEVIKNLFNCTDENVELVEENKEIEYIKDEIATPAQSQKDKQNEETIVGKETLEETTRTDTLKLEEEKINDAKAKEEESTKPNETPIYAEAIKHEVNEGKHDKVVTTFNETLIKEAEKPLYEVKEEETVKNEAQKLENEKVDKFDLKSSKDMSKEIPTKTTYKQSNSIILKLKHSFGKVKKAILGKSPSSKTIISQAKSDIEVK